MQSHKVKHKIPGYPEIKVTAAKHSGTITWYLEKSLFGLSQQLYIALKKH